MPSFQGVSLNKKTDFSSFSFFRLKIILYNHLKYQIIKLHTPQKYQHLSPASERNLVTVRRARRKKKQ